MNWRTPIQKPEEGQEVVVVCAYYDDSPVVISGVWRPEELPAGRVCNWQFSTSPRWDTVLHWMPFEEFAQGLSLPNPSESGVVLREVANGNEVYRTPGQAGLRERRKG